MRSGAISNASGISGISGGNLTHINTSGIGAGGGGGGSGGMTKRPHSTSPRGDRGSPFGVGLPAIEEHREQLYDPHVLKGHFVV